MILFRVARIFTLVAIIGFCLACWATLFAILAGWRP